MISEEILARASASVRSLARLVGSSDKEPSLRQSTGSKGRGSGVDTDKGTEARLVGDISNASGNLCKGACVRSSTWKLQGRRAHNLLKRRVRSVD